ncbi:MAG: hypothetical protein ACKV19_15160, partial [Verrucomicrobiales bacterium]
RNVVREFRDLVWQRDQIEPLLNYFEARVAPFHLADRDRWPGAPAAAGNQRDGPFATRVADMKRFAFIGGTWDGGSDDPQDAQSKDTGISGRQGRDAFLDYLQTDAAIPVTPTATYTGPAGYPLNNLTFSTSPFSDPQGAGTFGALEWRIAEYQPNAIQPDDEPLIPALSEWKYDDGGVDRGTAWREPGFDDAAWLSGPGELGYGETSQGTTLSFGGNTTNRHMTYYFRKKITVADPGRFTGFRLAVRRDDGAVVYVNGVEVFRTGMPAAPAVIAYSTPASADVNGVNETTYFATLLALNALVEGENTIAVEVHQRTPSSTDLRFDLTLGGIHPVPPRPEQIIWEYEYRWKSPVMTTFTPSITIPASAVGENRTYRVRVRHQDDTGRWSHWSAPVEFLSSSPGIQPLLDHLAISEIMYDPSAETPAEAQAGWTAQDFEYIELENRSATQTLDLTDVRFTKGVDVDIAAGTRLAPRARCLVVRSAAAFALRYGAAGPVVGEFATSRLNNTGEELKLSFGGGVPIREFAYLDQAPWPAGARNTGASISFLPATDLARQGDGLLWRAGPATPGAANTFPPGWEAWRASYFDPLHPEYETMSTPYADADGDTQATVVEYVLGSSPATAASQGALGTGVTSVAGTAYFTISYLRRPDVTVTAEASAGLASWSSTTLVEIEAVPQPDGSERVTYRDNVPVGTSVNRFLRLRVSKP